MILGDLYMCHMLIKISIYAPDGVAVYMSPTPVGVVVDDYRILANERPT